MPDDVALEKSALLRQLGATVERVKPCSIIDKKHFVNLARERAEGDDNGTCDRLPFVVFRWQGKGGGRRQTLAVARPQRTRRPQRTE